MIDKYVHKYCMEIFDLYMTEKELRNEFNIVSTTVSALKTDIRQAEETIITQGIAELRSYNGIFIKAYTNIIATITGNLLLIHKNSSKSTPSITSKPKHVISLGSIRGIEVNEYKRENKPTEYILFIAYDKTNSSNISSISDNSFDGERDVDFSTSLPSPSTNTRSISIAAPTLTPMSVASPNCKTICIRILEQFDSIPNNHDSNFYHSFISSLSSLIPPSSNIIHKTNSNQNQLDCNSNNRSSSTEESGTNNEDFNVRGSTLTTATAASNQSHEFIGRNIARRNSFPPRNYTEIIKNIVIKPSSTAYVAAFTNTTTKDRNSVFSTKLIKRGTFIGDSRSNASVAPGNTRIPSLTHSPYSLTHSPYLLTHLTHLLLLTHSLVLACIGTESSDAVSNKSGKMITNLILLQEKLVFSREKRTLLQDELVLVITNRERAHEIFRLLSMFKRIVNCEDIEVMATIERELSPFIGLNQDDKDASNIDQCIAKMTSCSSIIRCDAYLLTHSLTHLLTYLPTHSLTHSLTLLTHSLTLLTHLTYSLLLTYSLILACRY